MSLMGSNATIRDTLILNSNSNSTPIGFFNLMMQSDLKLLDNSIVTNIYGKINGLLSAVGGSTFLISNNVTVSECYSQGSLIGASNSPNMTIRNATFLDIGAQLLIAQSSTLSVSDS